MEKAALRDGGLLTWRGLFSQLKDGKPVMISVVVYGRNDSYGYNLHKRAAISLNCIAEVLTDPNDEILFVDYNTPDDFPTFPEAIQDTLTDRTKKHLRILRARPPVHDPFRAKSHLIALEPVARNIAIRRSNPRNRWILSTNTDIVFVLRDGAASLTESLARLQPGFYEAPRLEIPETIWEGFNRLNPQSIISTVKQLGVDLHLDEIVRGSPDILFDGPGDFQLMERDAIFKIGGFHEEMLLGWHVDSNLCVRMRMLYGKLSDASPNVWAYHCDHTRQTTPAHKHGNKQNDPIKFVSEVTSAEIPEQAQTWGCPNAPIEEIRLGQKDSSDYVDALRSVIGAPLERPYQSSYISETFDQLPCPPQHVLPFLADLVSSMQKDTSVAWFGSQDELLRLFARTWSRLGFTRPILVEAEFPGHTELPVQLMDATSIIENANLMIFNSPSSAETLAISSASDTASRLWSRFIAAVAHEQDRLETSPYHPRRFIGINAIHSQFESAFRSFVGSNATPFSSRIRHGFVLPKGENPTEYLPHLQVGGSGQRLDNGAIRVDRRGNDECAFYGPYRALLPGDYELRIGLSTPNSGFGDAKRDVARIQIVTRDVRLGGGPVTGKDVAKGGLTIPFTVPMELEDEPAPVFEFWLHTQSAQTFDVTGVTLFRHSKTVAGGRRSALSLIGNFLNVMQIGAAGERDGNRVKATGRQGHVVYGPFFRLRSGTYAVEFELEIGGGPLASDRGELVLEVVAGETVLVSDRFRLETSGPLSKTFEFAIQPEQSNDELQLRVWTNGARRFSVVSVTLRSI